MKIEKNLESEKINFVYLENAPINGWKKNYLCSFKFVSVLFLLGLILCDLTVPKTNEDTF